MLVKIKDVCQVVSGATPSTSNPSFYDGDIYWITPKDLADNGNRKYIDNCGRKITTEGYNSCSTVMIPSNNILISTRAPIGYIAINKVDCCTNQGFKSLICNKEKVVVDYLFYLLKSRMNEIELLGSGTTFKEVSKTSIENFEIDLPPLETQEKIASILTQIDNQIERNNAMVKKLQVLSQGIFNYYYSNNEKRIVKLKSIAEMYQPETITGSDFIENGKYLVYGSGGIIGRYDKYNHEDSELMISCRGLCGNISLSLPLSWIIGNQMIIKPFDSKLKYYLYNYLKIINLKKVETGSVQKQITRTNLENLDIELLDDNVLSLMEKKLILIHQQIIKTITLNDKIITLKNKLLPLLINQQLG